MMTPVILVFLTLAGHWTQYVLAEKLTAIAVIAPDTVTRYPEKVIGKVVIYQESQNQEAVFRVVLKGLKPNTTHGFHVHQFGHIIPNGCRGAGGHYNPFHKDHHGPSDISRHVGDLGNIYSDKDGKIDLIFKDRLAGLAGSYSIYGRSFVIHQKRDDLGRGIGKKAAGSKKTGNAGARLACGVIVHAPLTTVFEALHGKKAPKGKRW